MRHRKTDIFFFICGLFMLSGEIWKQLTLTFILGGGQYNWWYFPFQLCSIPMYILILYPRIRRSALKQALLTFLMCYGLLGGIAVFALSAARADRFLLRLAHFTDRTGHIRGDRLSPSSERPSKKGAPAPFSVCHRSLSYLLPGRRILKHDL